MVEKVRIQGKKERTLEAHQECGNDFLKERNGKLDLKLKRIWL